MFALVLLLLKAPFFRAGLGGDGSEGGSVEGGGSAAGSWPLLLALFAGLIFAVHPIETQAVTYAVQRFTSLATMFYLFSLVAFVKWRLTAADAEAEGKAPAPVYGRVVPYSVSILAALLAFGTKEIAFTLPIILVLTEFSFFTGKIKRRLINLAPFFLALPLIPLSRLTSNMPTLSAEGETAPPSIPDYFFTQLRVVVTYLRLFFFPVGQNFDYDYPIYSSFFNPNVIASFLLLAAIAALGVFLFIRSGKKNGPPLMRLAAFGIFWFFITLAVESSVIPIADVIFEHRLYLPSIGLIVAVGALAAAGIFRLNDIFPRRFPWLNKSVILLAALIAVTLAGATYARNNVWRDPATLWADTAAKSPGKARPHNNLGAIYQQRGQLSKALGEFMQVVQTDPGYARAYYNIGVNYVMTNRYDDAIAAFSKDVELDPLDFEAHNIMGNIYKAESHFDKALEKYQTALRINPEYQDAKDNLRILQSFDARTQ